MTVTLRGLATLAFFSSLFWINNPIVQLPQTLKFPLFLVAQLIGCAIVFRGDDFDRLKRPKVWIVLFVLLFIFATIRYNDIVNDYGRDVSRLYAVLTLATFCTSIFFARYLDLEKMAKAIIISLAPVCAIVIYHFADLSQIGNRDWYALGDISYSSYQSVSLVLSLTAISALYLAGGGEYKSRCPAGDLPHLRRVRLSGHRTR